MDLRKIRLTEMKVKRTGIDHEVFGTLEIRREKKKEGRKGINKKLELTLILLL